MPGPVGNFASVGSDLVDFASSEGTSAVAHFEHNRASCTRVYNMDDPTGAVGGYEKAYRYAKVILGYPETKTSGGGIKYIARTLPHGINRFVRSDGKPFLFATKCKIQGLAPTTYGSPPDGNKFPEYKHFRFTVEYETLPWEVKTDGQVSYEGGGGLVTYEAGWERYVTKIARPAGEFFTIQPTSGVAAGGIAYQYVGVTPANVTAGIGKLLAFCNLQVTWHQIPETAVPSVFVNPSLTARSYIETTIGKVNNAEFNGYAKGTLLLLGASMTPYRSPFGDRIFDVTYMFKYFEPVADKGHNYLFRPASNAFIEVTTSGATNIGAMTAGVSIYDWADFTKLFTAA